VLSESDRAVDLANIGLNATLGRATGGRASKLDRSNVLSTPRIRSFGRLETAALSKPSKSPADGSSDRREAEGRLAALRAV